MLIGIVAYIPSLFSYFQEDDWDHLRRVTAPGFSPWAFREWFYRPLFLESFRALYRTFGLNAVPWHVAALAVYVASIALLYFLIRRLGLGKSAAFVGAALFAVHPMHPEAVGWLSALSGVAAALFGLAAAHVAITRRIPAFSRGALCATLWMVAVFFKEDAASLIVVLPFLPFFVGGKKTRGEIIGWALSCLLFIAGLVIFQRLESHCHNILGNPTAQISLHLLRQSVRFTLTLLDGAIPLLDTFTYLGVVILSIAGLLLWKLYPWLRLGLLWFFGTAMATGVAMGCLSPTDRYGYIPSIGMALAYAAFFDRAKTKTGPIGCRAWIPAIMLYACLLSIKWGYVSEIATIALIALFLSDPIDEPRSRDTYIIVMALSVAYQAAAYISRFYVVDFFMSAWADLIPPLIIAAVIIIARSVMRTGRGGWAELTLLCCLTFWVSTPDFVVLVASCALIYFLRSRLTVPEGWRGRFVGTDLWMNAHRPEMITALLLIAWFAASLQQNMTWLESGRESRTAARTMASLVRKAPRGSNVLVADRTCASGRAPGIFAAAAKLVANRPDLHIQVELPGEPGSGAVHQGVGSPIIVRQADRARSIRIRIQPPFGH